MTQSEYNDLCRSLHNGQTLQIAADLRGISRNTLVAQIRKFEADNNIEKSIIVSPGKENKVRRDRLIHDMYKKGKKPEDIAREIGIARATVYSVLGQDKPKKTTKPKAEPEPMKIEVDQKTRSDVFQKIADLKEEADDLLRQADYLLEQRNSWQKIYDALKEKE